MKKTFTLFALISVGILNAQSPSIQAWTMDASGTNTVIEITNGNTLSYTTSASNATYTGTQATKIRIKNISSTNTNTYSVQRFDVVVNPAAPSGANVYFCFGDMGSCYTSSVYEAMPGDYNVLTPGAETVNGKLFTAYLDEAYTIGYSEIRYKLFNLGTGKTSADTLSFTIKYNQFMSVKENANVLESVSNISPNPSTNNANITVVLTDEVPVKVQVFNSLGALVYNGAEQQLNGKNKLAVDCTNFNNGLYFITVTAGNAKVTKRLVVNK